MEIYIELTCTIYKKKKKKNFYKFVSGATKYSNQKPRILQGQSGIVFYRS